MTRKEKSDNSSLEPCLFAVMGLSSHPLWFHLKQQPHVAEDEDETEEDEVAEDAHNGWYDGKVVQQVSGEATGKYYINLRKKCPECVVQTKQRPKHKKQQKNVSLQKHKLGINTREM